MNNKCSDCTSYGYWDSYREPWNTDTTAGLKMKIVTLKFDGGIKHKDGERFAIASLTPPLAVGQLSLSTQGLQADDGDPVSIDLGLVSFGKDCSGCPMCENLTYFLEQQDVSDKQCGALCCGPWTCSDGCGPECCPELPSLDCCPDEDEECCACKSDLVLTLHGTPAACSVLKLVFFYN